MTRENPSFAEEILEGIPVLPPPPRPLDPSVDHAPPRRHGLDAAGCALALANALRYLPPAWHAELAPELARELAGLGHIYMHRLRPRHPQRARPLADYPARSRQAAAIMLMLQNNLDPEVAQYPHELVTYGGNGSVFQNWAQYRIAMRMLATMGDDQTLVLYSGHPLGLFPSHAEAPRVVVTNGMVVPNHSRPEDFERMNALGVTSYGQMTAGSFMYIGPQGIVHGTTLTLLNAGRLYLGSGDEGLAGRVYVTSGLGGMSGAQAKAAVIAGAVGIVAEIDPAALHKRHAQGWLDEYDDDAGRVLARAEAARRAGRAVSIGYLGNVVDLWERIAADGFKVDLGSDQTSLHNPFHGGYYPVGHDFAAARALMHDDPAAFRAAVEASLRRQVAAINRCCDAGMRFWDYGNAFLVQARAAGADVDDGAGGFRHPSYVEDLMGPLCFDFGFGPFRWVCASGDADDLAATDALAADVLERLAAEAGPSTRQQNLDNLRWIREAGANRMVVGSQARILYADRRGRRELARVFNAAIADGTLRGPVVLGRDHHDVSGTDSPWRETANIRDGSRFTADMAVHNFCGDAFRGATWVSLHNGGGVGWGEAINGGFGLLLDGTPEAGRRADAMLCWDVANGVARRAWARNPGAEEAIRAAMADEPRMQVTLPERADAALVEQALADAGLA